MRTGHTLFQITQRGYAGWFTIYACRRETCETLTCGSLALMRGRLASFGASHSGLPMANRPLLVSLLHQHCATMNWHRTPEQLQDVSLATISRLTKHKIRQCSISSRTEDWPHQGPEQTALDRKHPGSMNAASSELSSEGLSAGACTYAHFFVKVGASTGKRSTRRHLGAPPNQQPVPQAEQTTPAEVLGR